jgi:hypothetical protein
MSERRVSTASYYQGALEGAEAEIVQAQAFVHRMDQWRRLVNDYAALESQLAAATERAERAETALAKINEIRNSIVGSQTVNWSEHVYPLVAALDGAGVEGLPYPEAREHVHGLIDRARKAERNARIQAEIERDEARAELTQARETIAALDRLGVSRPDAAPCPTAEPKPKPEPGLVVCSETSRCKVFHCRHWEQHRHVGSCSSRCTERPGAKCVTAEPKGGEG